MKQLNKENKNGTQIKALLDKTAPKACELRYGIGDDELVVMVYPVLPFTKRMEMVREIVNGVFMGEKNTVNSYAPECLALIQKYAVISFFTDLSLPKKLDDMWLILNYTPIYEDTVKTIGEGEINDIFMAADNAIDTYRSYLASKTDINSLMNRIGGAVNDIESKIPQEDLKVIASKLKGMSSGASFKDIVTSILGNKSAENVGA